MLKSKVYLYPIEFQSLLFSGNYYVFLQGIIMARITVEDCLKNVNNRFALIHMAAKRVRQLRKGDDPTIVTKNRDVVIALREIAAGNVIISEEDKQKDLIENMVNILSEEQKTETGEDISDNERGEENDIEK
ncbi:MAG: DNA-directed RNA polymerase subunit omega [Thermodesulfobacteriota bacterium]|nr:DNA-directed RNA polymerase subunit omega [Thermodesulfobacteriota bacterium]